MIRHEIKKITRYEYWPFWIFYIPMIPVWFWFSIKTRSFTYFTAVNPGIKFGGFFNYSKFKLQQKIQEEFRPQHQFISDKNSILKIDFPIVAKPDIGERGKNVQLINNQLEWERYANKYKNFIVQKYIDFPFEFGVFYAKLPTQKTGKILSITAKNFLEFIGDGKTSLREFIESDARAYFNKSYLYMKFHDQQELVLEKGEKLLLEEIGNHNRGTYFYDATHLITSNLESNINKISQAIDGFFYGRFDVKTKSLEDFKRGNFVVLEVNGSNSEPTHIYDKNYVLIKSYKEVYRHLKIQYQIAQFNINQGYKPATFGNFTNELIQFLLKN